MNYLRNLYHDAWVWSMRFSPMLQGRAMSWSQIRHLRRSRHSA